MASVVKISQDPIPIELSAVADDDFSWSVYFEEELTAGVFTPMALSTQNPEAMIKKKETDPEELDHWTIVADNPSVGWMTLSLTDAQTKELGKGKFWTSVRLTKGTYTRTYLAGPFELTQKATYD